MQYGKGSNFEGTPVERHLLTNLGVTKSLFAENIIEYMQQERLYIQNNKR